MNKIVKLLSHGASFAAGVAAGRILSDEESETVYVDRDGDPFTPWQGPTETYEYERPYAEDVVDYISGWLEYDDMPVRDDYPNPFWEDDLKDFRMKAQHAMADAEKDEPIKIEVNQRQRLLLYDLIIHGPPLADLSRDTL